MTVYMVVLGLFIDNTLSVREIALVAPKNATEEELYEVLRNTQLGQYSPEILDWYQEY